MKKNVLVIFISLFILSCASNPAVNSGSIDQVIQNWSTGLKEKNIDLLMDTYWPEAVFTFIPPKGDHMVLRGSDAIRSGQEGGFKDRPPVTIQIDKGKTKTKGSQATYTALVKFPDVVLINTLELEKRDREWRIINQTVRFQ